MLDSKAPSHSWSLPFTLFLFPPLLILQLLSPLTLIQPCQAGVPSNRYLVTHTSSSFSSSTPSSSSSTPSSSTPSSSSSNVSPSSSFSSSSSYTYYQEQDVAQQVAEEPIMACYYGSWAVYRPGRGKFNVEDIDPFLCTHVLYAFAGLQESTGTIVSLDPYNDLYDNYGKGAYIRFTSLKKINPNLKTLLSIGGWNEGSSKYSKMAWSATSRSVFITSCVKFLLKYGFDGLDLDWEYPTLRGGRPQDKVNFALLLEEMKARFKQHYLLLTSSVSAGKATIDAAYNVTSLTRNLDYVFLMAYDFHGSWETYAHHHSPLYAYRKDKGASKLLNVDFAVRYWLQVGLPPERLVMGVGLYGRCFTLARADQHDVYAPAPQPGRPGPYTRSPGILGYNEVCEQQQQVNWTVVRDKNMVSPYAYYERQWCGYDDVTSVAAKTKYIKSMNLAGAMVWSIETDDFHGVCQTGEDEVDDEVGDEGEDDGEEEGGETEQKQTFPLITTIRTILRDGRPIPTPTPTPAPIETSTTETTTTSTTTTTTPGPPPPTPPPSTICHREGLNRDPDGDCTIFYICHQVADTWLAWLFHCPPGTRFVESMQVCDHPQGHPSCPLLPPVTAAFTTTTPTPNTMPLTLPLYTDIVPNTTAITLPTTDTSATFATPSTIVSTSPTITTPATTVSTIYGSSASQNTPINHRSSNGINYSTNLVKSRNRFDETWRMDSSNTFSSSSLSQLPSFSPSSLHSSSSSSSSSSPRFPEKTKNMKKWRNTHKFLSYNEGQEVLAATG